MAWEFCGTNVTGQLLAHAYMLPRSCYTQAWAISFSEGLNYRFDIFSFVNERPIPDLMTNGRSLIKLKVAGPEKLF